MNNTLFKMIIDEYKQFPEVQAIAIGGSIAGNTSDNNSDIDVYIFITKDIPIEKRLNLTKQYSQNYEVGGEYFGPGDEFFVEKLNKQLDVMYWNIDWFENTVQNIWHKHYPSNGYTTCFLYTLKNLQILFEKDNWLTNLKKQINTPYPAELKNNIIKRNLMLLKDKPFASYYEQIQKAIERKDINSINHRISAFLASYFDIIFAANELLHPGEKRLIKYAQNNCSKLPKDFENNITRLLQQPNDNTIETLDSIITNLKEILH